MLPGYFIYPAEQVPGAYQVRVGYGTGAYRVRHVAYWIILIGLTGRYGWVRLGAGSGTAGCSSGTATCGQTQKIQKIKCMSEIWNQKISNTR
jgi:hypothetical protein